MFRWVEIALECNRTRYELLSEILTENGFENKVDFLTVKENEFETQFTEALNNYDGIRIGRGLGEIVVPLWNKHSVMVDKIKAADAVVKIFEVKNRPHFDPLIVHVASIEDAKKITTDFNEKAQLLATKFWPGPLTLVLKKKNNIPPETSGRHFFSFYHINSF